MGGEKIFLFGDRQKNSTGTDDYWEFSLEGDKVSFEFRLLFDANTDEGAEGSGEFERHVFARWLEERLSGENIGALFSMTGSSVNLEKMNGKPMIQFSSGNETITVPFNREIPSGAKQRLGITC